MKYVCVTSSITRLNPASVVPPPISCSSTATSIETPVGIPGISNILVIDTSFKEEAYYDVKQLWYYL